MTNKNNNNTFNRKAFCFPHSEPYALSLPNHYPKPGGSAGQPLSLAVSTATSSPSPKHQRQAP